jgi:FKBP-type peptidyl-prolyl cis-trans isomerase
MKRLIVCTLVLLTVAVMPAMAQDKPAAAAGAASAGEKPQWTEVQAYSYAVGVQIGSGIKNTVQEFDTDVFYQGMQDALKDQPLKLSREELQQAVIAMQKKKQEEMRQKAEQNLAEQKKFFEENAKKEGVVSLPSGLQYKIITEGTGPSPVVTDRVKINYRGTFPNGEEFDSSAKRGQPAELQINKTIKGWQEALPLMKVGSKWELYIPSELAYGTMGQQRIPPNQMLIFEVELLEIVPTTPPAAAPGEVIIPNTPAPATPPAQTPGATPQGAAQGSS